MNANEARAATIAAAAENITQPRKELDAEIAKAAGEGKNSIYYFGSHALGMFGKAALFRSLERDGFAVKHVADPDPGHPCSRPYTEISW